MITQCLIYSQYKTMLHWIMWSCSCSRSRPQNNYTKQQKLEFQPYSQSETQWVQLYPSSATQPAGCWSRAAHSQTHTNNSKYELHWLLTSLTKSYKRWHYIHKFFYLKVTYTKQLYRGHRDYHVLPLTAVWHVSHLTLELLSLLYTLKVWLTLTCLSAVDFIIIPKAKPVSVHKITEWCWSI